MQTLPEPYRVEPLNDSLEISFYDLGNRYYGDYHRVKVIVRLEVVLSEDHFHDEADPASSLSRASRWLGKTVTFEKSLERMGVSGGDVEKVRSELIDTFLQNVGDYLRHPDFPRRLVRQQLKERQARPVQVPGAR
jgi:hypothetical protein